MQWCVDLCNAGGSEGERTARFTLDAISQANRPVVCIHLSALAISDFLYQNSGPKQVDIK